MARTSLAVAASPIVVNRLTPTGISLEAVKILTISDRFKKNSSFVGDCSEVGKGMSLTNLPSNEHVLVTVVEEGVVIYQAEQVSDSCGVATPFTGVALENLGSGLDDESVVYARVIEDPEFYFFSGIFIKNDAFTKNDALVLPLSTQWIVEDGDIVPVSNETYGFLIGPLMIP